jgi:hypothetical protein
MWSPKPQEKLQGQTGEGWLRSPDASQVVRIASAGETIHAKWVEVTDADVMDSGHMQIQHNSRMLRFNALQLWENLIRRGWKRVPPQW